MNTKKNISENTVIFATGVNLKPKKVEINGKVQWRWIAVGFEDASFYNGQEIEVYDYAENVADLVMPSEQS